MNDPTEKLIICAFSAPKPGPHLLISAGVHGDEYEPILAAFDLIRELPGFLTAGRVTVVPVANRSAYEAGSRFGADGLDFARICPGNPNGTVTEKAAVELSELIRQADYYIDLHTGGNLLDIYPLAGYMLHPSPDVLITQRQMATDFGLPLIWGTDSTPNGRTLSVARDAGVPAIYVEYGGGTGIRENVVTAYHTGCINVMKSLKLMEELIETPVHSQRLIEDDTSGGGYLQGKMPAPTNGIFAPEVTLGDPVEEGQVWGHILDPVKGKKTTVQADREGFVFMLRVGALVKKGDSLGGIMPGSKPDERITHGD